ncbi:hypothetical protein [Escherichia coli]|uniref:hypothetical protein n=1 Tax=Escherichia coli TaxID=562 RepID=UPI00388ED49B
MNFVADVSTAGRELVVIGDGSGGRLTATRCGEGHRCVPGVRLPGRRSACWRTTTVAPTVITEPDGTVEVSGHQPDRRNQCGHRQRQRNSSQSRNVTFVADVRTAKTR